MMTHTDVCLCLFIRTITQIPAASFTKLDTEMLHHESCKPFYCGVKSSKVKVTRHQNSAGVGTVGFYTLLNAGFF